MADDALLVLRRLMTALVDSGVVIYDEDGLIDDWMGSDALIGPYLDARRLLRESTDA